VVDADAAKRRGVGLDGADEFTLDGCSRRFGGAVAAVCAEQPVRATTKTTAAMRPVPEDGPCRLSKESVAFPIAAVSLRREQTT
jgi:hypothetical protein